MKRFERSNGLDTALYENYLFLPFTSNTVLLLLVLYCTFSEDSTCPGGPRHKPFGVSRGSPRSQLCI